MLGIFATGVFGIVFSYVYEIGIFESFRVGGGTSIVIGLVGTALHVVKGNNKDIMNFVSGVLVILIWIFLILPYVMVLPIASIFITDDEKGLFIYGCILGTTLLLILLVSVMSIVFNVLMNKF